VSKFKYLGAWITEDGGSETEMKKGWEWLRMLSAKERIINQGNE